MKTKIVKTLMKFILVGSISTTIDFIVYFFISKVINILLAKGISFIIASIVSFYLNKNWTFNQNKKGKYFIKYFQVQLINLGVNVSMNFMLYTVLNERILPFIIATLIATIVNFLLQRLYVFNSKK